MIESFFGDIHDISLPISESLVVWPGDPPVKLSHPMSMERGDMFNANHMDASVHLGTHVDAPFHFVDGGTTVESLDLDVLVGPALVVEATEVDTITASVLENLNIPPGQERILFRTRNSERRLVHQDKFAKDFCAVTADGARWLVENNVRLVGMDYLSVAPYGNEAPAHQVLLGACVVVVEGLDLCDITPGKYQLVCLPLKIVGSDGAPARAILIG